MQAKAVPVIDLNCRVISRDTAEVEISPASIREIADALDRMPRNQKQREGSYPNLTFGQQVVLTVCAISGGEERFLVIGEYQIIIGVSAQKLQQMADCLQKARETDYNGVKTKTVAEVIESPFGSCDIVFTWKNPQEIQSSSAQGKIWDWRNP
ncbi:hypothetical protein ACFL11_00205 [Patescibacteria group bacterium]